MPFAALDPGDPVGGTGERGDGVGHQLGAETGGILAQYWGKSFTLSQWYPEYNWVADDGPQNFDRWVG